MKPVLVLLLCWVAADACADDATARIQEERLEAARQARRAAEEAAKPLETRACAPDQRVVHVVDLDRPGALAELKSANPAHFRKLLGIEATRPRQLRDIWTWMHTQADACEVFLANLYRTSFPAQARLSFVIDDTRYSKTVHVAEGR